jgi:tryptophanase
VEIRFEPYRSRVVEPLRLTSEAERRELIREAGYNPFLLRAEDVLIDLVTDSGTSALSTRQWSAMHGADESFSGSRSFHRFQDTAREVLGFDHVLACHQGRAAEHLLCRSVLEPGDLVLGNTLFATTRANVEAQGAEVRDLPIAEHADPASRHPFKGDIDLERLASELEGAGRDRRRVAFVVVTITDNSGGGHPVSLANLQDAHRLCQGREVPLLLDAARMAEGCCLIKLREPGQSGRTVREIARDVLGACDGVFMSMKKDGLGNCGGLIALDDAAWMERIRVNLLVTEGVPTAGGLAGRDLESMAVALDEMLDDALLEHRIATVAALGSRLTEAGVPVLQPFGGHAVYVDGRAFCPHLDDTRLPAWSTTVALYVASGVRTWEVGNVTLGRRDPVSGDWIWPRHDLLRLAVPRRVYSRSHLDYVADCLIELYHDHERIAGLRFVYRPPVLPQFIATFEPDPAPAAFG